MYLFQISFLDMSQRVSLAIGLMRLNGSQLNVDVLIILNRRLIEHEHSLDHRILGITISLLEWKLVMCMKLLSRLTLSL